MKSISITVKALQLLKGNIIHMPGCFQRNSTEKETRETVNALGGNYSILKFFNQFDIKELLV